MSAPSSTLSEAHRHMLQVESRISPEVILARGYRTIDDRNELESLGFKPYQIVPPALYIPGLTPAGKKWAGRIRPDIPRRDAKKKPVKYEQPEGENLHLDCNPLVLPVLKDPTRPLAFVEGEKKADSLFSAGLPAVALPGVYGWKSGGAVNAEFEFITLKGRQVYVIFDSDAATNRAVRAAETRLSDVLTHLGAKVKIVRIPPATDDKKQGADDYLAAGHSLGELLAHAQGELDAKAPREPKLSSAELAAAYASMGVSFSENVLTGAVHINGQELTDADEAKLRNQLRDNGLGSHLAHARDVMVALARANRFSPVKQFIEREVWDGKDHIGILARFISDKDNLFSLALRRWMLGAVDRIERPGAQNRMLVLVGAQGLGKSGLAAHLAQGLDRRYFVESGIQPDSKDDRVRLTETFIWEVMELGSTTRRADVEALKGFLSLTRVNIRRPYAKNATDAQAITSFIGTLNDTHTGFLSDSTGERRFTVCELTRIDWGYSKKVNVAQLWAQAKAAYDRGERGYFSPDELALINKVSARFYTEGVSHSGLEMMIELDPEGFVATDAIVRELKTRGYSGHDDQLAKNVADYMTRRIASGAKIAKSRRRTKIVGQTENKKVAGWDGVRLIKLSSPGPGPWEYAPGTIGADSDDVEDGAAQGFDPEQGEL